MSGCCTPVKAKIDENGRVERCCARTVAAKEAGNVQSKHCPACGQKGKMVDCITPKAMLNVRLLALQDTAYLFCPTAACDVVYFSTDGRQLFTTEKIRVPVHQKEPGDQGVPICYCFRHSPATIRAELLATGQSTVIEEISAGIKAGHCACEIRNPQGSCCLGNVRAVVTQVGQAIS